MIRPVAFIPLGGIDKADRERPSTQTSERCSARPKTICPIERGNIEARMRAMAKADWKLSPVHKHAGRKRLDSTAALDEETLEADPIPVMETLASNEANLDARDVTQDTLLMHFARHGKAELVQWLLAHGADRYARNKSGKTAAEIGRAHAGIVRLLTKYRAEPCAVRVQTKNSPRLAGMRPFKFEVGTTGFEPATSCTPSKRASQSAPRPAIRLTWSVISMDPFLCKPSLAVSPTST
jgi:hypothetical protein